MKHTALPWTEPRIYKDSNLIPYRIAIYAEGHDTDICSTRLRGKDHRAEENFKFISLACNCHEELVEACQEAESVIALKLEGVDFLTLDRTLNVIKQALTKATK